MRFSKGSLAWLGMAAPEEPGALVAHDEVDALHLAVDQHVLLDQLALDLVRELLARLLGGKGSKRGQKGQQKSNGVKRN